MEDGELIKRSPRGLQIQIATTALVSVLIGLLSSWLIGILFGWTSGGGSFISMIV